MNEHITIFKKATIDDKNEIAEVLLDFYNMNDLNEAINAFSSELEKHFLKRLFNIQDLDEL